MVNFLMFISLLIAGIAQAAVVPSGVPSITLGGYTAQTASHPPAQGIVQIDSSDTSTFTLYAGALTNGGSGVVYPFRKNGSIYSTHATKRTYCRSIRYRVGSASGGFQLMSATATFADAATTGSLTGPVYQCGAAAAYCMSGNIGANVMVTEGLLYEFAAGAVFPGVQFSDNTQFYQVYLTCKEI